MSLIREALHVVRDLIVFGVTQRRAALVVAVLLVLAVIAIALTATTVAPVVIYPFV